VFPKFAKGEKAEEVKSNTVEEVKGGKVEEEPAPNLFSLGRYGARFRHRFTLDDAIKFYAFARPLEALACVWPMSFFSGVRSSYWLALSITSKP
jgi:hypothetical protein